MWKALPSVWAAQLELRVQDGTPPHPTPGLVPSRWLLVAALCLLHVAFSLLMVSILQDLSVAEQPVYYTVTGTHLWESGSCQPLEAQKVASTTFYPCAKTQHMASPD